MAVKQTIVVTPESLKTAMLKWFLDHQTGAVASHEALTETGYTAREAVEIQAEVLFNILDEAE